MRSAKPLLLMAFHHIGVRRTHARTHVSMVVQGLDVRIINAATGELIRELTSIRLGTIQREGSAATAERKSHEPKTEVHGYADVLQHHTGWQVQDSNLRRR